MNLGLRNYARQAKTQAMLQVEAIMVTCIVVKLFILCVVRWGCTTFSFVNIVYFCVNYISLMEVCPSVRATQTSILSPEVSGLDSRIVRVVVQYSTVQCKTVYVSAVCTRE